MVLRICERHGWALAQWANLRDTEKKLWIARELYRDTMLTQMRTAFETKKPVPPPPPRGAPRETNNWTPEVAMMWLLKEL